MTWYRQAYLSDPTEVSSGLPSQPSQRLKEQRTQRRCPPSSGKRPPQRGHNGKTFDSGAGGRGSGVKGAVRVSIDGTFLGEHRWEMLPDEFVN